MPSSVGNATAAAPTSQAYQRYVQRAWQSKRHAHNIEESTMATKNTTPTAHDDGTPVFTTGDFAKFAYATFESADAMTSWLDDPRNFVERTVKVKGETRKVPARRTLSASAALPDDVYYQLLRVAAGDKQRLDDGDLTYSVRQAVWQLLGHSADDFKAWNDAEQERISSERSARMSGVASGRSGKVSELESENASLKSELDNMKAQLEKLMAMQTAGAAS